MRLISTICCIIITTSTIVSCKKDNIQPPIAPSNELYFPPISSNTWATTTPESLGWNTAAIPELHTFISNAKTKGFIVLQNGKIVIESYYGNQSNGNPFSQNSLWYWASAGKTLTAFVTGIANSQGYINLQASTSTYLGNGWTSLPIAQEKNITVSHQLTMTTGLDDAVPNQDCTTPSCLQYKALAGTRWAYHNAPYTLLESVIAAATKKTFSNYYQTNLRDIIGMDGQWVKVDDNNVYFSTARSMARFGLLLLAEGNWDGTEILNNPTYFSAMTNSTQSLNPAYGYLTWLNGKQGLMIPSSQTVFNTMLASDAPPDMYAAMGKNGQLINVIPSKKLVIIRMGDNPDISPVPTIFQNQLWQQLNKVIK